MGDKLYKLEVLAKIRIAISSRYSDVNDCKIYHECMEMTNDIETEIIAEKIDM